MRQLKNLIWKILNFTAIGPLLQLYLVGEIKSNGWLRSFKTKKSEDSAGNPIPWYTYPFVDFLKEKLNRNLTVFEYGCGGSTKWLAERVKNIVAVEDHEGWYQEVSKNIPNNIKLIFQTIEERNDYAKSIQSEIGNFDLIIVDGKIRNLCIKYCTSKLSERGVVVLDDSFREDYKTSFEFMKTNGFKHLNFWGMTPVISTKSCTTLFYKTDNIFNI
ncbi:FkbM family methyltransferase [Lacihabitans sp. CCS-44]|uniref:class I SAM-dependent methyltransferase n=1 Tax=Lacihabitans sp. CCS-44 TaxID=2487331 RepID=UPI0020CECA0B|nr:class I SAM-dependent methyltransferase [Lacihabitans sp. CCS-44]MCP9754325.1 FkbM family methyltransferase [Lacihabitans sp. CCS-44]